MPHKGKVLILTALLVSFLSISALAKTIHVPADQPTIQAGIDIALNGDTVLVSAGTYFENISFNGKAITVMSASGPNTTVVDGSKGNSGTTVNFSSNEKANSVITGFTIQNGSSTGINVYFASPTITGNVLTLNGMGYSCGGTAISVFSGAPVIQGNLITGNLTNSCGTSSGIYGAENSAIQAVGNVVSGNKGSGIQIYQATNAINVSQNTITQNDGQGLFLYSGGGPVTVVQNLIVGNQGTGLSWYFPPVTATSNTIASNAPSCCGIVGSEINANDVDSTVVLENNLVVATGDVPAVYCGAETTSPTLANNDVFALNSAPYGGVCQDPTGTNGNLSADPLFVDLLGDNFDIQSASPVVNAGNNTAPDEPKTDMHGNARIIGGTIDIGADEYTAAVALSLSTLAIHFKPQDVGTTSAPQTATLTNQTTQAVTINLIATGGGFSQTNNCGTSLAAGANCQINISFSPVAGGTIDGAVGIFTSATANPQVVSLVGIGLAPQVQLPCCFYFYNQVIGTSNTQTGT